MNFYRENPPRLNQSGMSLLELLIAVVVLVFGILGSLIFLSTAMGTNFRNRQVSNSTAISQMVVEKIMSVGANQSPTLTMNDCAGSANTLTTAGSSGGSGAALLANGDADFTQAPGSAGAPAGYYMLFTDCGTAGRQIVYDVRWNIKTPTGDTKLVTVSTRMSNTKSVQFSPPVTVRSMLGP
jgi:Tfp pilus assembly protein PilV